ncbi:tripartite tricarboxylate transporter substrate binding protein [Pigmentiphaga sp.]|uniref:Bug family tripartite tricarboxylate transporter substrate binding protein n=1 Tax=Pigmentiphaga sp. TaxID=1977564 RepID=UPI00128B5BA5|nr:tripartite tricarboxylate transporter substrate binding protein [Pigmentiphaga sp.]MPS29447.1 tripartite tricarboxylate transporter substrate binding protein [Alcaligenaceae bacterium SAGV5]MPS55409.1 tripartite tricarboxylate transporter substrate binding protein [Alcaligenaceae bacterium SAGV3]MPT60100.1 tripartite tricarboxylate transporter substrate binding protein [Alcaligenaceae bacterium]
MKTNRRRHLMAVTAVAAMVASLLSPAVAREAAYPAKPISLLVGFAPGGSGDFVARAIAQYLGPVLGQTIVVENRPGANGLVAATHAAAAKPDGYTLLITTMGLTTNPYLYGTDKADPIKDFTPISMVADVPNVLVTHPAIPGSDLGAFINGLKSRPTPLSVATTGQAAPGHLASELLQRAAGVKFDFVAYKGSAPALTDVMAGHVDASMPTVVAALAGIKSNKLRALAVTGAVRSPLLPDVPTFAELGISEIGTASGWYGMVAPAGVPPGIANRLSQEIRKVMETPEVRAHFLTQGATPRTMTSAEMGRYIADEYSRWGTIIQQSGIKAGSQ